MQDTDEPTTQGIRAKMEAYITAASESTEIDSTDFGAIDEIATKFLDSLTPRERGLLMYDDPQPLSLQEVDSDITEKYRAKYGTKNLKRGQFFRLKSGTITFFYPRAQFEIQSRQLKSTRVAKPMSGRLRICQPPAISKSI